MGSSGADNINDQGIAKAPIKMKVHNFDPFGVGFQDINHAGLILSGRGGSP